MPVVYTERAQTSQIVKKTQQPGAIWEEWQRSGNKGRLLQTVMKQDQDSGDNVSRVWDAHSGQEKVEVVSFEGESPRED